MREQRRGRGRSLDERAVGCEVASHDSKRPAGIDGIVQVVHHAAWRSRVGLNLFHRSPVGELDITVQAAVEGAKDARESSRSVKIFDQCRSRGLDVDQYWRRSSDAVDVGQGEVMTESSRHGRQVDDGVGRAADSGEDDECVGKCVGRHHARRRAAASSKLDDALTHELRDLEMAWITGRYRRRPGPGESERLGQCAHSAGGAHGVAGAFAEGQVLVRARPTARPRVRPRGAGPTVATGRCRSRCVDPRRCATGRGPETISSVGRFVLNAPISAPGTDLSHAASTTIASSG